MGIFHGVLNPYIIDKNSNRNQPNMAARNFLIPINSKEMFLNVDVFKERLMLGAGINYAITDS